MHGNVVPFTEAINPAWDATVTISSVFGPNREQFVTCGIRYTRALGVCSTIPSRAHPAQQSHQWSRMRSNEPLSRGRGRCGAEAPPCLQYGRRNLPCKPHTANHPTSCRKAKTNSLRENKHLHRQPTHHPSRQHTRHAAATATSTNHTWPAGNTSILALSSPFSPPLGIPGATTPKLAHLDPLDLAGPDLAGPHWANLTGFCHPPATTRPGPPPCPLRRAR